MKNFVVLAVAATIAGLTAMVVILCGARFGIWEPIRGFRLYREYFDPIGYIILGAGVLSLIIHTVRTERRQAGIGGMIALIGAACLVPVVLKTINPPVRSAPIHDISTDTVNVPQFVILDETRAGASNTLVYGGAEVASAQAESYPDIAPLISDLSPDKAFARALEVAAEMKWEIVAADPELRRFEATAYTPVFYFADDIVVTVTAQDDTSRIDMRGVSRVGRSDQGMNAKRIRAFQERYVK